MAAARADDRAAAEVLFRRHYRAAVAVAMAACGDRHRAEDAAQQAAVEALRSLASLRDGGRFGAWLTTIVRRTAARGAREAPLTTGEAASVPQPPSDDAEARRAAVRAAVDRLPRASREVVLAHYFAGLSHAEAGAALGLSAAAAHGRLQRARAKLATLLRTSEADGSIELLTAEAGDE